MAAISPYTTAAALARPAPNYTPNILDKDRVQAYFTYADIFNNVPEAFSALLRSGDDELARRYIPAARAIVEATNRYLGLDLAWVPTVPADVTLADDVRDQTLALLDDIFKREEFNAKFMSLKRWFLIKGDALLHISVDPAKAQFTRLRITELAPEQYFPIFDAIDAERVIGCYVLTILTHEQEQVVQRLEYRRILNDEMAAQYGTPIGQVWTRIGFYELEGWDDRSPLTEDDLKPVPVPDWVGTVSEALTLQMQGGPMAASIQSLPVYHFRNNRRGTEPFGTSELQGLESILAGITQNATDEDMAAALMGLGMYATDSGHPTDENGNEVDWEVAPASIIELEDGKTIKRIEGLTTVQPIQDHIAFLKAEAQETSGVSDVAAGRVDVAVAQSGIALAIQMAPTIGKNQEKEEEFLAKLRQFMYDLLNGWLPGYEGVAFNGLVVSPSFGDPLPVNRKEEVEEVVAMVSAGIIDAAFGRELLAKKLGITFPADMETRMAAAAQATLDAEGARVDAAAQEGALA